LTVHLMESVQKSVAHLNLIMKDQLLIKGVPHLNEHAPFIGYVLKGRFSMKTVLNLPFFE